MCVLVFLLIFNLNHFKEIIVIGYSLDLLHNYTPKNQYEIVVIMKSFYREFLKIQYITLFYLFELSVVSSLKERGYYIMGHCIKFDLVYFQFPPLLILYVYTQIFSLQEFLFDQYCQFSELLQIIKDE